MSSPPAWLVARPVAHRGFHDAADGRPENTLAAAEAAIARGYGIECDVQLSADNEVVVFHDADLARLTGEPKLVRDRSAAELGALSIAGTAERIPTLDAFLERIAGRTSLFVELKSRYDRDGSLAARTAEIASRYEGPIALESFDPFLVAEVRRLAPSLVRGIVGQASYDRGETASLPPADRHAMANLLHWDETRPDYLSWRAADLTTAAPFLARRLGKVPITAWTIRSQAEADAALLHADAFVFEGFEPA